MNKFIITFLFIFPFYSISEACTCGSTPNIRDNWEIASQVFIGEVIGTDTSDDIYSAQGVKVQLYTIRILENYKYDNSSRNNIRTFTNAGEGSCDIYFQLGSTYLIYADTRNFEVFLSSSVCSRTDLLANISKNELKELEKLHAEFKLNKNNSRDIPVLQEIDRDNELLLISNDRLRREKNMILIISMITVVILIGSLVILWRRKYVK